MKKILLATTAAGFILAVPAYALDAGVKAGGSADTNIGADAGTGANAGAGANVGVATNASAAVSAMSNSQAEIGEIKALQKVTSVVIVDVDTLAKGDAEISVNKALTENKSGAVQLQTALQSNADIIAAIKAEDPGFDLKSVVAADAKANGELVIYTKG